MSRRSLSWALVVLSWVAFGLRVQGLAFQSLWRDEIDSLRFASQPLAVLLENLARPGHNGPLYYLLLRPWLEVSGTSEFSARFLSVFLGVLAVPIVYQVGRQLMPREPVVAVVASALAATSPYLVWYSQEARMYAAVVCICLLSMYLFLAAVQKRGWGRWLGYIVATGLALYVHLLSGLIVLAQAGILVALRGRHAPRALMWFFGSLAALFAAYVPVLAWQIPFLWRLAPQNYPFVRLPDMVGALILSYAGGVIGRSAAWSVTPALALVCAAVLLAWPGRRMGAVASAALWLVIPVLALFLVTLRYPLFTARYLVFVLPALLLLVAMGAQAVGHRSRWLAGFLLAAVLASNLAGLWLQARTPLKADFRSATQYVASKLQPDDLVVFQIPYGRFSFEYYLKRSRATRSPAAMAGNQRVFLPLLQGAAPSSRWIDGLYTNGGMSPGEVDRQMASLVADGRVVWLVTSEAAMWDERGMVEGWLDSHATLASQADFVRVTVRRYRLR
jgi:uncharacterized membrane protein